jgi:glycine/D-amino acid oxidase-like deaminating enzyme/nitrite reductase/ring-hydroxylating ferredoxin subunit
MAFEMKPIWDEAVELADFAPLSQDLAVDVAVIGAGLTGITTTYLLARSGLRVALLERRHTGGVDTGCTTAHLTAVIDTDLPSLARRFGRDHAQAIWDAGLAAIDRIDAIARECEADCGFAWVPGFRHVPFDAGDDIRARDTEHLVEEAKLAADLGFDVDMIGDTPLMGQPGWRIDNQALFHPRKYLKALLAWLATRSTVTCARGEVEFGDDPEVVTCGGHRVRAPRVVVATHNPLIGRQSVAAAGWLQTKLALYTTYALAADAPAGVDVTPGLYWDTADPYRYVRVERHGDGFRFIVGGEDHKTGQEPDTTHPIETLDRWFTALVPTATITHHWSGQVIETADGLPFIGEVADRQFVATGYAGNGMTFGTLSAMILHDAIVGAKNPWRALFDTSRTAITRGPLDYLRENADYPYYLVRDRFAGADTRELRSVRRGEGRLVEVDGEVVAASRDRDGALTLLSPTCTHLGCRVHWNTAEGTWDCPCHGSRFTARGEVLAGPAESPLERRQSVPGEGQQRDDTRAAPGARRQTQ